MLEAFLNIINKPFAELTLLDLLKVGGAFVAVVVVVVLFVAVLSSKPNE